MNFNSFYSNYGNSSNTHLLQLLSNPSTPLLKLIDNDNFISEFKSSSTQVKQYMSYKKFQELISYVTEVASDQLDKKRGYKYPFTACQILCCQSAFVFEKFVPSSGVIIQEEKIVTPVQQEIQEEVDDSDEDEKEQNNKSEKVQQQKNTIENTQNTQDNNKNNLVQQNKQQSVQKNNQESSETAKTEQKSSQQDDQFGDFVETPAKKKKIIKLKQVVDQVIINKVQYKPFINNLFSFYNKPINYTLAGYVCKILTTILNKRTTQFFTKLFQSQQTITDLLKSIQSRSVVDLFIRILTIQNRQYIDQRYSLYKKICQRISQESRIQILSNISCVLCQVYQKVNTHLKTLTPYNQLKIYIHKIPQLLEIVVKNIFSSQRQRNIYSTPVIYEMLTSFANEPQQTLTTTLISLLQGLLQNLQRIIRQSSPRIGIIGIKTIQILNFISKNKEIELLIIQKPIIFNLLIQIIQLYPNNNILHCQVFKLINNLLIINTDTFINNILQDQAVVGWLQQEVNGQLQRIERKQRQKKCYMGHIINFCVKLRDLSQNNNTINTILQKDRYINIMRIVNDSYLIKNNRSLAGYSKDRNTKPHLVMFSKQDILTSYTTFLSKTPAAVFKIDEDDPLSNPALLQQLQKQLDGISTQYDNMTKQEKSSQDDQQQLQNQVHQNSFFKVHMDYDAQALLLQLD